jgi:polysaccharide biosynthesis protein PslJ
MSTPMLDIAPPRTFTAEPDVGIVEHSGAALCVLLVLWFYPLWWLLGVNAFTWLLLPVPIGVWLVNRRRPLVIPRGMGLWLLFLGWVVLSATALQGVDRIAAATYRGACYLAAGMLLIWVVNTRDVRASTRTLTRALTGLWLWSIGLSIIGLLLPGLGTTSLAERVLPAGITHVTFVHALIHPQLSSRDPLIGVVRPRPLFDYTNNWGSGIGLLTPIAVYTMLDTKAKRLRLLLGAALAISVIPIVISIDRGLWVSIGVAVFYVMARMAFRGNVRVIAVLLAMIAAIALAIFVTPLGNVINERLHASNTSTRQTLYSAAIADSKKSPVIGYGSPVSSAGLFNSNDVSVGTHGQLWTVLVSQGYPGTVFFVGFLLVMIARTWRASNRGLWLQAVPVVAVAQLPFYDPLPLGLCVTFLCIGLCLSDRLIVPLRAPRSTRYPALTKDLAWLAP